MLVAALLVTLLLTSPATGAVLSRSAVSIGLRTVSWSAVATSTGVAAGSGPYQLVISGVDKNGREGLFDIVNSGASAITGFTLVASASSGIASGTGVVYDVCSAPWVSNSNTKTYSCPGTSTVLASSTTPDSVMTVVATLNSGARLFARASCSAASKSTTVSQTLSVRVARSQAQPKANR